MQNNIAVELIVLEIQLRHLNLPTHIQVSVQSGFCYSHMKTDTAILMTQTNRIFMHIHF